MGATIGGYSAFENSLLSLGTIIFLGAAAVEFIFLIHYIRVAPAFKSWIGWMFVLRSFSFLMSAFAIILGRIAGPDYAARPYLTALLYSVCLISALVTYATFLYERHRGRVSPRGGSGGRQPRFARRGIGLRATRREEAGCAPEDEAPRLRIVEEESA